MTRTTLAAAAALAAFALASCGGGGVAPAAAPSAPTEPTAPTTPGPTDPGTPPQRTAADPNYQIRINTRDLTHATFGLWRATAGFPHAGFVYDEDAEARPAVNGTWRGTAIGHTCGRLFRSVCGGSDYSVVHGTAVVTYNGARNEVSVDLSNWRDAEGTRLQDFREPCSGCSADYNDPHGPITLDNFVASKMEFVGKREWFGTQEVRVSFYGGSDGRPAEAFGTWTEDLFEAAFGATRR